MATNTTRSSRKPKQHNPKGEPSGVGGKEQQFSREEVEAALRSSGGLITQTAAKLKCPRATVYEYLERYPELKLIRREADEHVNDLAEANIIGAIAAKNIGVSQWWLNQKARHRGFGDRMTLEGDPDNPIPLRTQVTVRFVRPDKGADA